MRQTASDRVAGVPGYRAEFWEKYEASDRPAEKNSGETWERDQRRQPRPLGPSVADAFRRTAAIGSTKKARRRRRDGEVFASGDLCGRGNRTGREKQR